LHNLCLGRRTLLSGETTYERCGHTYVLVIQSFVASGIPSVLYILLVVGPYAFYVYDHCTSNTLHLQNDQ